jgi:hypothetical protein
MKFSPESRTRFVQTCGDYKRRCGRAARKSVLAKKEHFIKPEGESEQHETPRI